MKSCLTGALLVLLVGALGDPAAAQTGPRIIRTVAGGGASDPGDDGPALDAVLANPGGMERDSAGNLYIADTSHHRIRKVDAMTGLITTVAGTGVAGFSGDGGPATAAQLNAPWDVAIDAAGNTYIADTGSHCVRRIDAVSNQIQTVAGTCGRRGFFDSALPAIMLPLDHPTGVAVNARGNVLIADRDNHRIRALAGDGFMHTLAGNSPIPFSGLPRVVCPVDWLGGVHTPAGMGGYGGDGGPAGAALLRCPTDVHLDGAGNMYIADTSNHAVRKVTAATGIISTVAGGHFYEVPGGVFVQRVCSMSGDGGPATAAYLCDPKAAVADAAGNVYIADTRNHRIRRVAPSGVITTIAGTGLSVHWSSYPIGASGFSGDDGPATSAQMSGPSGLAVDPAGAVYVADSGNNRIRTIVPTDIPLSGDLDGDGRSDLIVWRPSTGTWYWLTSSSGLNVAQGGSRQWGSARAGDIPLLGEIDGDGLADLIIWRASTGVWHWLTSSTGYDYAYAGARQWGNVGMGDVPLIGDVDGDRRSDMIVWRASTGTWFCLTSSSGYSAASQIVKQWGALGDVPLVGDTDGDGKGDLVVWRPDSGTWFRLTSSTGYDYTSHARQQWGSGALGDVPLLEDLDGDHQPDLTVWRASTGTWYWLSSQVRYDPRGAQGRAWGSAALGDVALLTDLDGDGRADLVVWRASTGTWYWLTSSSGYLAAAGKQWGSSNP